MRGPCNDSGKRTGARAVTMLSCVTCCLAVDSTAQNVANPQCDINADALRAILFSVKMP